MAFFCGWSQSYRWCGRKYKIEIRLPLFWNISPRNVDSQYIVKTHQAALIIENYVTA